MLPQNISLKAISQDDLNFLFQVYASTREDELNQTDWSDKQKLDFLTMQFNAQHKQYMENYQDKQFSLILFQGTPVGRLFLNRAHTEIRIVDIAILKEYRGQGIGSSLLNEILQEGDCTNKVVSIHVERSNPALHLYQRLGFHVTADREVYHFMERLPASVLPPK